MMKQISFSDVKQLSAYLDDQLSWAGTTRLEARLKTDTDLASVLGELRQARHILRHTPQRRAPRNFMLTPMMAGIKPPVPRLIPALSWASAVALLFFVCTLGTNFLGQFSFGAAAPVMLSAPESGYGGGPPPAEGMATTAPAMDTSNPDLTATPEIFTLMVPEATSSPDERTIQPPGTGQEKSHPWVNPWLLVWPALASLLGGTALVVRWAGIRAFRRRTDRK